MRKYKHHKYTWTNRFGNVQHRWELVGPNGALHYHVSYYNNEPSAGLEYHHLTGDGAPDHVNCPLTGGRCWHDGTSLYAIEGVYPRVLPYIASGDHEKIFKVLEYEADIHFDEIDDFGL